MSGKKKDGQVYMIEEDCIKNIMIPEADIGPMNGEVGFITHPGVDLDEEDLPLSMEELEIKENALKSMTCCFLKDDLYEDNFIKEINQLLGKPIEEQLMDVLDIDHAFNKFMNMKCVFTDDFYKHSPIPPTRQTK